MTCFDINDPIHRNEVFAALHETTVGSIGRLDVTDLLETLTTRAGQFLDAPHGFIYLPGPGQAVTECKVGAGILGRSVSGGAVRLRCPVIIVTGSERKRVSATVQGY